MGEEPDRQRIVAVPGARRARLTPVPGTDAEPEAGATPAAAEQPERARPGAVGPNDERLRCDVPPHY